MRTLQGPALFLAQFIGDEAPFDRLDTLAAWAARLGYRGVQVPTSAAHVFDLQRAAQSQAYCDDLADMLAGHGSRITELSTHLQGQLVAVHPIYDAQMDGFAPPGVHNDPKARQQWAVQQLHWAAAASKNLGLTASATFSGALVWPFLYPFPQRPAGLVEEAFDELARRWTPILDSYEENGVDLCYEIHPSEDLHDGVSYEMFLERVGNERRYTRKLRELQVAFELERSYEKDQILEAYINEIYMGRGYGFQSASRAYFGKDVTEVNVAEAALLAAILNRPTFYDPFRNPEAALRRRNLVLSAMVEHGHLDAAAAEEWKMTPLPTEDHSSASVHGIAPYFEEWVRQILDSRFGDQVYREGLRVYTTLDLDVQRAAVEAMTWGWQRIEATPGYRHPKYADFDTVQAFEGAETPYLQGMMVVVEPQTGQVKALIGGRDFEHSKFDRARLARRQAGSAFKPFVYAAALSSGLPASHIVSDQPVVYPQVSGEDWRPSNFDRQFRGPMTIREGLRRSINMVAIKLGWEEVGIETVAQTARRMGIASTQIERFPSTTIGAVEVIPLELAEAYTAFACSGCHGGLAGVEQMAALDRQAAGSGGSGNDRRRFGVGNTGGEISHPGARRRPRPGRVGY